MIAPPEWLDSPAEGYFSDTSHTVAVENGDASLEVALERGQGVSGVVRLSGGEAASGAHFSISTHMPARRCCSTTDYLSINSAWERRRPRRHL